MELDPQDYTLETRIPSPLMPPGAWVLGHNQQQGVSTLQAGARALLLPSDLTRALSSIKGRVAAQTLMALGGATGVMNYASFRPYATIEIIRRSLPADLVNPTILDPAGGYSPEFFWYAEQFPQVTCLEFDLPEVIRDKQERLKDLQKPDNFIMQGVDLSVTPLHEALQGRRIDLIILVAAYVPSEQFVELLKYLRSFLAPGTLVLTWFTYKPGVATMARNSILLRRFAIEPVGAVEKFSRVQEIFEQAEYQEPVLYKLSELAKEMGKPVTPDIEVIGVARC